MTTVAELTRAKKGIPGFAQLQRVGRSLMLPIASLPAAALLLRLGQPDMLGADGVAGTFAWMQPVADVLGSAGNALFSNLPIIFALGAGLKLVALHLFDVRRLGGHGAWARRCVRGALRVLGVRALLLHRLFSILYHQSPPARWWHDP